MKSMIEIWADIENFEGIYQVSNLGKIKSLKYGKEKILKPAVNTRGYYHVSLVNHKKITKTTHRLEIKAFIPNPENKPCVNHKDGNKLNNYLPNLEWCTYSENCIHAFKLGLTKSAKYWKNKKGKYHNSSKSVLQFTESGTFISKYGSQREAFRKTKIHSESISAVCRGKRETAGGYKWEFDKTG